MFARNTALLTAVSVLEFVRDFAPFARAFITGAGADFFSRPSSEALFFFWLKVI
jgi:hypothetical protein